MEAECAVAVVFRCFEEFLRKAGTMNVFDTLVYNYRLKDEFLNSVHMEAFSIILDELIQNLTHLRLEIDKMSNEAESSQLDNSYRIAPLSKTVLLPESTSYNFDVYRSHSVEKDFIDMIALDGTNYSVIASDDLKNSSGRVGVVGDLQTLMSVELNPINVNAEQHSAMFSGSSSPVCITENSNAPESLPAESSEDCEKLRSIRESTHNNSEEMFLIPILKEMVKSEEELSISNICSMLGSNECAAELAEVSQESLELSHQNVLPASQVVKQIKVHKRKNEIKRAAPKIPPPPKDGETDESLLFFCCDKCFHSFRTEEKFSVHKCSNTKGVSSDKNSTLIKDNPGLRNMKKFVCGLCLEEYRNLDRIAFHLKRCEGGPFSCELCPNGEPIFSTVKSLNFHKQQEHKEQRSFICRDCGFPFKFKCSLQKHKLRAHNTELQPKTFPCDMCPTVFLKKIFLTNHKVKDHNVEREFLCQICGQSYTSQQSLKAHIDEAHYENNKFPCEQCEKVFSRKEQLNFHMTVHTGVGKTHLCATCGKSFSKKSKLDDHYERRHTEGLQAIECGFPNCSKSFKTKKDQKSHHRRMHSAIRHLKDENSKELEEDQVKKKKKSHKKKIKRKENSVISDESPQTVTENKALNNYQQAEATEDHKHILIQEVYAGSSHSVNNHFVSNPLREADLSCQGSDEIITMSDFMDALTPGQIEQIIQADFLVPTLIP